MYTDMPTMKVNIVNHHIFTWGISTKDYQEGIAKSGSQAMMSSGHLNNNGNANPYKDIGYRLKEHVEVFIFQLILDYSELPKQLKYL